MNRPLFGPNGQVIGQANPVVAHVVTIRHPAPTKELIESVAGYWQRNLGVPCIIVTGGVELIASVLADGQLIPVHMDPEMTVKVQTLIDGRSAVRPGTMPEVVPDTIAELGPMIGCRRCGITYDPIEGHHCQAMGIEEEGPVEP